ncbi:glycerophosphodiester phosphodiesterase [Microbulbifer thermotolerans]|nr:glycerophosphodiester phosphodiesterase [Microbulbifer thermotolerans]MCX2783195.1 glycerophosphodiester phosphodiesterase [Microbulbifer thermotolerans]MCX2794203.1 glycerophosphodiester phosphodiesterase [Microbulbifer thermotolerans]MCX2800775.1 glycerophosphodiester phosphodiesterase [Microbulbifer thermotolerans]MCX2829964.1 glycerophosphodiester phosphodiesterase [Microbulbifer thermotolerans]MCX2834162.1 glycerophosphodiester phosphodiesterase [Microbulbifer thermotolerans]
MQTPTPLFCFAHRGYRQRATENTLQAIAHALEFDVDGIEVDIWNIRGQLLVKHDRRLGRLIAGSELLTDLCPEALRQRLLPCGQQVPTLREVLELVGNNAQLNIEMKGPGCAALVAAELESYVRDSGASFEQYLISSFDHRQLYESLQLLPEVRRGVLIDGVPLNLAACAEPLKAYSVHLNLDFADTEMIADGKRRGLKNYIFTVNHPDDLPLIAAMGADGVFTDEPRIVMDYNARLTAEMLLNQQMQVDGGDIPQVP